MVQHFAHRELPGQEQGHPQFVVAEGEDSLQKPLKPLAPSNNRVEADALLAGDRPHGLFPQTLGEIHDMVEGALKFPRHVGQKVALYLVGEEEALVDALQFLGPLHEQAAQEVELPRTDNRAPARHGYCLRKGASGWYGGRRRIPRPVPARRNEAVRVPVRRLRRLS